MRLRAFRGGGPRLDQGQMRQMQPKRPIAVGDKAMRKRVLLLAFAISSLSSCQPSEATYADNLPQGVSEGYVFYAGLNSFLSDGSDSRHLLSSVEYGGKTYDIAGSLGTKSSSFCLVTIKRLLKSLT